MYTVYHNPEFMEELGKIHYTAKERKKLLEALYAQRSRRVRNALVEDLLLSTLYWYSPSKKGQRRLKNSFLQKSYQELSEEFQASRSAITRALRHLEKSGLVYRLFDQNPVSQRCWNNVMYLIPDPYRYQAIVSGLETDEERPACIERAREHFLAMLEEIQLVVEGQRRYKRRWGSSRLPQHKWDKDLQREEEKTEQEEKICEQVNLQMPLEGARRGLGASSVQVSDRWASEGENEQKGAQGVLGAVPSSMESGSVQTWHNTIDFYGYVDKFRKKEAPPVLVDKRAPVLGDKSLYIKQSFRNSNYSVASSLDNSRSYSLLQEAAIEKKLERALSHCEVMTRIVDDRPCMQRLYQNLRQVLKRLDKGKKRLLVDLGEKRALGGSKEDLNGAFLVLAERIRQQFLNGFYIHNPERYLTSCLNSLLRGDWGPRSQQKTNYRARA